MPIADELRAAFAASGRSVYEVARAAGVPYTTAERALTQESNPTLSTAERLAAALGRPLRLG